MKGKDKVRYVLGELGNHLPYSIFGVALGLVLMGLLTFFAILLQSENALGRASEELFHVFHPIHVLFSAVASTAMFWKHEKRIWKAAFVGVFGSVVICALSDIFFPFWGGLLLNVDMHLHICVLEEPFLILSFAAVGVLAGFLITTAIERSTEYSHSLHVFVSSVASILYLVSFGLNGWTDMIGGVFLITIVSVVIPCCVSDIVFPLFCLHRGCQHG
ncbi:MAG: hypothetical protein WC552_06590, partial [Candidatus Omnitrophota bacterium]